MNRVRQLINERRWLVWGAGLILLFGVAVIHGMVPLFQEMGAINDEITYYENELNQITRWNLSRGSLSSDKAAIESRIEQLKLGRNEQTKISQIVAFLHEAANAHGIDVALIRPRAIEPGTGCLKLPMGISCKSRYHALGRFLCEIETGDHIIRVNSIRARNESWRRAQLTVDLVITVYFLEHKS